MQKYQSFTFLIAFYCNYLIVDGLIAALESYVLRFLICDRCRYKYCELLPSCTKRQVMLTLPCKPYNDTHIDYYVEILFV